MSKVFLSGYYGYGNIGDNMLLDVIVSQIKEFKADSEITILSRNDDLLPELDVETVYFDSDSSNKIMYFISLISFMFGVYKQSDIVIFGGGTQIFDNSKYSWKPMFVTATVLLLNKIFLRRKIIHYGNGIGTLETKLGRFFTKCIGALSNNFILRDEASYNTAREIGISPKKILLARDLAYSLVGETFPQKNFKNSTFKIGFSLFDYYKYTKINRQKSDEFQSNILSLLRALLENSNNEIYLFAYQTEYGNKDDEFAFFLKQQLASSRVHIVPYSNDWKEIVKAMSLMDLCIGMRYHFLLMALKLRKRIVAINYSIKVETELKMFGIEKYTVPLDNIEVNSINYLISKLITDESYNDKVEAQFELISHSIDKAKSQFRALICD